MTDLGGLELTAYHEAGHVVVAWLCDHMLGKSTIRPDHENGILGGVQHSDQGCSELFEPFILTPHPDAPGGYLVRTSETTGGWLWSEPQARSARTRERASAILYDGH